MSFLCGTVPVYRALILGDYTVLGRWAMPSLCGTARLLSVDVIRWLHCFRPLGHVIFVRDSARLSCVDLRWLYCFRPLGHAIFVPDCPYIVCWVQDFGLWAFLMVWTARCCSFSICSRISFAIFQVYKMDVLVLSTELISELATVKKFESWRFER